MFHVKRRPVFFRVPAWGTIRPHFHPEIDDRQAIRIPGPAVLEGGFPRSLAQLDKGSANSAHSEEKP
jgi:hypothetical protein